MTPEIVLTLGIIFIAMVLFFTERFSIDSISIGVMVFFLITGILDVEEGLSGFSNNATITVASMFIISAAIFNTGVMDQFRHRLSEQAKKSEFNLMLTLMCSSGILSAFINDTAVVALLMPTVIKLSKTNNIPASKLLIPLSFGALLGGVCTLFGTSTNILVSGIAEQSGLAPFGIFEMSKMGIIFLILGILYMLFLGRFLLPKRKGKNKFGDAIDLGYYLSEIIITNKFEQLDTPISKQAIFNLFQIQALQIRRSDGRNVKVYPNTPIHTGDIIHISSDKESLEKIKTFKGIVLKSDLEWTEELVTDGEEKLYEAVITPNSILVNQSIKSLNFKELFNQVLVIGIRLRAGMLSKKLTKTELRAGDILLLRASEDKISSVQESEGLVLISETTSKVLDKNRIVLALLVLMAVIILSVLDILPIVVSAMAGALMMIFLKVLKVDQAYKAIDWKVILMLAGILSMGTALEKTGGSELIGRLIVNGLGELGPRVVLSALFGITFMMTNVMSNNATAALLAPIAISIASALEVDSRPLLMSVTFAASLSFMTPMGYQTNTMVYSPGNYKFIDYLKVGTPLNILFWIVATIFIPLLFPF